MLYPDENPSWVGYPGVCQSTETNIKAISLSKKDRTIDGNTRITKPSNYQGADIIVVHNKITDTDKKVIFDYYDAMSNTKFKFLYRGDLSVYRVAFENQPDKKWIGVNDSGESIWKITCKLSGIFEYTETMQ
jgi:Ni,Fe-hydrogenase III small subunit